MELARRSSFHLNLLCLIESLSPNFYYFYSYPNGGFSSPLPSSIRSLLSSFAENCEPPPETWFLFGPIVCKGNPKHLLSLERTFIHELRLTIEFKPLIISEPIWEGICMNISRVLTASRTSYLDIPLDCFEYYPWYYRCPFWGSFVLGFLNICLACKLIWLFSVTSQNLPPETLSSDCSRSDGFLFKELLPASDAKISLARSSLISLN